MPYNYFVCIDYILPFKQKCHLNKDLIYECFLKNNFLDILISNYTTEGFTLN